MGDDTPVDFVALWGEAQGIIDELRRIMPLIAEARRTYFRAPGKSTRPAMEAIERQACELHVGHVEFGDRKQERARIMDEDIERLWKRGRTADTVDGHGSPPGRA